MAGPMEIGDAGLERLLLTAATNTPWMLPVWKAVKDGTIELDLVRRDGKVQRFYKFSDTPLPILIIIGDDDGDDRGPAGWPKSGLTIGNAAAVMVNASGGEADHYRLAVERTRLSGVVVIIETSSQHLIAWRNLLLTLPVKPTMFIVPRGGVHPIRQETRH